MVGGSENDSPPKMPSWRFGDRPDQCALALLLALIALGFVAVANVNKAHFPIQDQTGFYVLAGLFSISAIWHACVAALMFRRRTLGGWAKFGPAGALLAMIVLRIAWIILFG